MATSSCDHILRAHGWVKLPMTLDTGIDFYHHGLHPLDRVQVFNGHWSQHHSDGESWLTHAKAHGSDAASLDEYLTKHFRSGGG